MIINSLGHHLQKGKQFQNVAKQSHNPVSDLFLEHASSTVIFRTEQRQQRLSSQDSTAKITQRGLDRQDVVDGIPQQGLHSTPHCTNTARHTAETQQVNAAPSPGIAPHQTLIMKTLRQRFVCLTTHMQVHDLKFTPLGRGPGSSK